jgi:hypothetical protein
VNTNLDFDLILYGAMLAGLGVLAQRLAPEFGYSTLITGGAGGGIAVILGVLRLRGWRHQIWPIVTLILLDIALLFQAVKAWLAIKAGATLLKPVAIILTVLLVFGVGQLVNFIQENRRAK